MFQICLSHMVFELCTCVTDGVQVYCQVTACYADNCKATTGEPVQSNIIHLKLEVSGFLFVVVVVVIPHLFSWIVDLHEKKDQGGKT